MKFEKFNKFNKHSLNLLFFYLVQSIDLQYIASCDSQHIEEA